MTKKLFIFFILVLIFTIAFGEIAFDGEYFLISLISFFIPILLALIIIWLKSRINTIIYILKNIGNFIIEKFNLIKAIPDKVISKKYIKIYLGISVFYNIIWIIISWGSLNFDSLPTHLIVISLVYIPIVFILLINTIGKNIVIKKQILYKISKIIFNFIIIIYFILLSFPFLLWIALLNNW